MKKLISIIVIASLVMMTFSCKNNGGKGKNADETCTECAEGKCNHEEGEECAHHAEKAAEAAEAAAANAQEGINKIDADAINASVPAAAQTVEVKPTFKGGNEQDFLKYVQSNIVYPSVATENGDQGKVMLSFVVDKNGKIGDVKVLRGVSPAIDAEAVRVVSSAPDWTPAKNKGINVPVTYTMPIEFKLK